MQTSTLAILWIVSGTPLATLAFLRWRAWSRTYRDPLPVDLGASLVVCVLWPIFLALWIYQLRKEWAETHARILRAQKRPTN